MQEPYAVVSASELHALRKALAHAFEALETLERSLIEDPIEFRDPIPLSTADPF